MPQGTPDGPSIDRRPTPSVVANGLTFQPAGPDGPTPLRDVSFRLAAGGSLLVAGDTGSGKSVLLQLIAGLSGLYPDPHASGSLRVDFSGDLTQTAPQRRPSGHVHTGSPHGTDRPGPGPDRDDGPVLPLPMPGRVVFVPQAPRDALLGLDVFSALALPLEEQGSPPGETLRRVEQALDEMGLLGLAGKDVASLSSGEARRVGLAGVLAQDASLVLLDEPFADLDPLGARRLREDLERLASEDRTLVVAEHRVGLLLDLVDLTVQLLPTDEADPRVDVRGSWPAPPVGTGRARVRAYGLDVTRGSRSILRDVELDLGPGVWGLIGPNGSGKTSLLWTLAGLLAPGQGDVEVCGVPVWDGRKRVRPRSKNEKQLRRGLQVAFQEPREAFFASSVSEELSAPLSALGVEGHDESFVERALHECGLGALGEKNPLRLSGGQARFVQLLGALLPGPSVLFLDEPSNGLDAGLRARVRNLLGALAEQGRLVVVATHEPDLLPEDAGWIFLPGDGRLVTGPDAAPDQGGPLKAGFTRGNGQLSREGARGEQVVRI